MTPQPEAIAVLKQFRLIFQSVKAHFRDVESECKVSGSQLWALSVIVARPGIRVTQLAKELAVHQSTASNLVERLVSMNLAVKERSESDQRMVTLQPTEAGRQVVSRAPGPAEGILPHALRHLPPESLTALRGNLDELIRLLKLREEGGGQIPLADIDS